jgi:hypothetical protein
MFRASATSFQRFVQSVMKRSNWASSAKEPSGSGLAASLGGVVIVDAQQRRQVFTRA